MLKVRGPSGEFHLSPKSPTLSPSRQNGRQICRQGRQIYRQVAKFVANISISGKQIYSFVTIQSLYILSNNNKKARYKKMKPSMIFQIWALSCETSLIDSSSTK
ncbi:hypothetical protein AVEN_164398-1 [Araneus ventricosus]|uniref:Uncharacterized protein n=1 Tax=Araneus ventricosus TaxID=182803 RepID=A0A4Y2E4J0_ARAVE|nr:hypothetical protein AVEN_43499-1 [Araneus ventricosus]GBM22798.1 hypothetical protein AVEN_177185-1 [Araneus ventricosus]GBM22803.1 hypothetical protein AVEN_189113-1 [Araneus ventricosus]GBM23634.1 hypothetical protein AVEN_164398-1 [Araneus ventricosus]